MRKKIYISITVIIFACLYGIYHSFTNVKTGEHLDNVSWLPNESSDICFYESYSVIAYEFNISQKGFLEWAHEWTFKPIDQPFEIERYSRFTNSTVAPSYPSTNATMDEILAYEQQLSAYKNLCRTTITTVFTIPMN